MVCVYVGASTLLSTPLAVHVLLWIYPYIPYIGMANPTKSPRVDLVDSGCIEISMVVTITAHGSQDPVLWW